MRYFTIKFFKLLGNAILFWSFALCLFIVIRYYALGDEEGIENSAVSIESWLWIGVIFGVIVGVFYSLVEFLFDNYFSKRIPLWLVLLQKSLLYLIVLIWSTSWIFSLMESELDLNFIHEGNWWLTSRIFWLIVGYFILASLVFSFIKIANENFGRGVFLKLLFGIYRKPKEEQRIFMFLDLKSSTSIAEKLGHFTYSRLIQDCFFDLNRLLIKYDASIYQYVGDEAVIHWSYNNGIQNLNCIKIFFAFERRIQKNRKHYLSRYNLLPSFKAGVHGGKLIATEVGTVKKEIAFHGDVINSTARIQEQCNAYDASFLISEDLLRSLKLKHPFISNSIGGISLKGKEKDMTLYTITKSS